MSGFMEGKADDLKEIEQYCNIKCIVAFIFSQRGQ